MFATKSAHHARLSATARSGLSVVLIGLTADLMIAAAKFGAAWLSGSTAMSSEGVHSLIDASTEVILLYGLLVSMRKASPLHQLGYGREVYFWNFVVAVLIFAIGAGVALLDGLHQIAMPRPLGNETVNYAVLALSAAIEISALWVAMRHTLASRGHESLYRFLYRRRDPTALTIVFGGLASLLGLGVTAAGVLAAQWSGEPRFDGASSVAVAVILALTAFMLAAESKALLIGLPADPETAAAMLAVVKAQQPVREVNGMISVYLGPERLLVALSVWFEEELSKAGVEQAIANIEDVLRRSFPQIVAIFVKPQSPERFRALRGLPEPARLESV